MLSFDSLAAMCVGFVSGMIVASLLIIAGGMFRDRGS